MRNLIYYITSITLALAACSGPYQFNSYKAQSVRINTDSLKLYDSSIAQMIAPYKSKLDAQMNEVIGTTETTLVKEMPDASLGNFVADACLSNAAKLTQKNIDFCVLNTGGVRIPSIQQGNITVGKIYELMPFDNMIDIVELNGQQCQDLFTWIAKWKGAPVSGLTLNLVDGKAVNIYINNQPFDVTKTYVVATTDFVANGGDGATMFAKGTRTSTNYKLRDALIEYVKLTQPLKGGTSGRIKQN